MCLGPKGGALILGGINDTLYSGEIQYTPIVNASYYSVELLDIFFANKSLSISDLPLAIVDSGTTLFYITPDIYSAMQQFMFEQCPYLPDLPGLCAGGKPVTLSTIFNDTTCWHIDADTFKLYPDFDFVFRGNSSQNTTLKFTAEYYFLGTVSSDGVPCSMFSIKSAPSTSFTEIIMGDLFMQQYYTIFDRTNQRMGFATVHACDFEFPSKGLSEKSIALIVVAVVLFVISVAVFAFTCWIRIKKKEPNVEYVD